MIIESMKSKLASSGKLKNTVICVKILFFSFLIGLQKLRSRKLVVPLVTEKAS